MEKLELFFNYWIYLAFFAGILIKILNKITKHFSEHKGLVKWLLFAVDLLDIIKLTPAPVRR